jgi:hypothetical protein
MTATHPAPVRHTDPETSHIAAAIAVTGSPRVRDAVYHVLTEDGPMTHDTLIAAYRRRALEIAGWPWASESSIRTRCSELRRDGLVTVDDIGLSRMGHKALIWKAIPMADGGTR